MATAFGPGYIAPGTTPIVPQYRVIGDYWSFGVQFLDPVSRAAVPLSAALVPGGEFFHAYASGPALDLTVAGGLVTVTDAPNGKVAYLVPQAITQAAVAQRVASATGTQTYPTRLQCFLTDSVGRQTYAIVGIVPVDPRTTDLSTIPPATTIVAFAGPAGAQGPVGPPGTVNGHTGPSLDLTAGDVGAYSKAEVDAAITAAIQGQLGLDFMAWFFALPTLPPSTSGLPWNNGGTFAVS